MSVRSAAAGNKMNNSTVSSGPVGPSGWLRRIRFGPRLLILAMIPLLALMVVIAVQAREESQRRVEYSALGQLEAQIGPAIELTGVLQELRRASLAGPLVFAETLPLVGLDEALAQTRAAFFGATLPADMEADINRALDASAGASVTRPDRRYSEVIAEIRDRSRRYTADVPDVAINREIAGAHALQDAIEQLLLQDVEVRVSNGQPDADTFARHRSLETEALAEFGREVRSDSRAAMVQFERDQRWVDVVEVRRSLQRPLAGSEADLASWNEAFRFRMGALEQVQEVHVGAVVELINSREAASRRRILVLQLIALLSLVAAGLATWLMRRSITRPVTGLIDAATAMSRGEFAHMDARSKDELGDVERAFNKIDATVGELLKGVKEVSDSVAAGRFDKTIDTENLPGVWGTIGETLNQGLATLNASHQREDEANEKATFARTHDLATGLPGPKALAELVAREFGAPPKPGINYVVARPANVDQIHVAGTEAISKAMAAWGRRLVAAMPAEAIVARISSTEFLVAGDLDGQVLSQRLVSAGADPIRLGRGAITIEPAVGLAFSDGAIDHTDLVSRAIIAAAAAVNSGAATPLRFHATMREAVVERAQMHTWLKNSIADRSIVPWFQPVISLSTGKVAGYEALARGWMNGSPVRPDQFIAVAESTGLIDRLGRLIVSSAFESYAQLPGDNPSLAVNFSVSQFNDLALAPWLEAEARRNGVPLDRIIVEITESDVVTDDAGILSRLQALRSLGMRVAVDDFGTGYSSLSYLSRLPLTMLKIDRSLITPMATSEAAAAVVARTIELAHDIGVRVVAEGIEEESELAALVRLGCDKVQGYLTGRPAPLDALTAGTESDAQRLTELFSSASASSDMAR